MNLGRVASQLADGVTCTFKARGHSMTPAIKDGDTITVAPLKVSEPLQKGEIVLARVRSSWYLHRVSAIEPGRVQISNNHGHVNGWCPRTSVIGKLQ